jgi:uncharacterized membrane protein YkvI
MEATMESGRISSLKVAGTYIGTVVGAGFASGQEIVQFFCSFGIPGIFGVVISAALFGYFGWIIMDIGRSFKADSYRVVIHHAGGRILGSFIDALILIFLFGALSAMLAGAGAMFSQMLSLPAFTGSLVMACITALTVISGFNGVLNAISFISPLLILSVIGISVISFFSPSAQAVSYSAAQTTPIGHWLLSSLLYVSYNTVASVAVLAPLGIQALDRRSLRRGAILGGAGLGIGMLCIFFTLFRRSGATNPSEVPMLKTASEISVVLGILYAVVLFAEVYTTAVGNLFGLVSRFGLSSRRKNILVILAVVFLALLLSLTGFSSLIRCLYPAVGILGLLLLGCLLFRRFRDMNLQN